MNYSINRGRLYINEYLNFKLPYVEKFMPKNTALLQNFSDYIMSILIGEDIKSWQEIKGVVAGISYIATYITSLHDNEPVITESLILDLHYVIMSPINKIIAGTYSQNKRYTIDDDHIRWYPSPIFVQQEMPHLLDRVYCMCAYLHATKMQTGITSFIIEQVIKLCAYFFHCFVSLHPFADGNGRTARILLHVLHSLISNTAIPIFGDVILALNSARTSSHMYHANVQASELALLILKNITYIQCH